ncbi:membrane protein containing RDD domain protein [Rhodopirellula islandica]|uniref:Membrane protein containing RDD domain protein n=1 Tax=Rhodopirellula islandica TaxID=595434 RepID=A0A0J1EF92_RHOIS|nr:membrane protein containing RDD domain protein [Rhodopirellula islandica]
MKCPCGKQLRVPAPKGTSPAGAASPAARPTAPARRPQPAASPLGADAGLFDELTETDLGPVAVAPQPGLKPVASSGGGHNPYASSLHEASDTSPASTDNFASQNKRFLNYFLDQVFIQIFAFGIGLVVGVVMIAVNGPESTPEQQATVGLLSSFIALAFIAFYYVGMEAIFGVTLAKLITGTRVVSVDGGKAGFGKVFGRTLARMIPFEPFSYLFGDNRVGWHDTLSGTRVIDIRKS